MPRDSGGTYTPPAGNPVAADTLVDAAWANGTISDLGNEVSNTIHKDGRVSMTGPLVLSTRGSPLDSDAASWLNILNRLQEFFPTLSGRAWRSQTKSGNYTAALSDTLSLLNFSATATLSLPAVASVGNGYMLFLTIATNHSLTIDPNGTELVNGVATEGLNTNDFGILLCSGTQWHLLRIQNKGHTDLADPQLIRPQESATRETHSSPGSVSGALTADCSTHGVFIYTLNGNATLSLSNVPTASYTFMATFVITQDATGGRSMTWPGSVKWPGGVAPTLSGANKTDVISLMTWDAGTSWLGFIAGQNF